jgi:hypothetical protein
MHFSCTGQAKDQDVFCTVDQLSSTELGQQHAAYAKR